MTKPIMTQEEIDDQRAFWALKMGMGGPAIRLGGAYDANGVWVPSKPKHAVGCYTFNLNPVDGEIVDIQIEISAKPEP